MENSGRFSIKSRKLIPITVRLPESLFLRIDNIIKELELNKIEMSKNDVIILLLNHGVAGFYVITG